MPEPPPPTIGDFPFTPELEALTAQVRGLRNRAMDYAVDHPLEALIGVLASAAWVFYQAEKEVNDDVNSYGDALHYISTCLSVGYARIFPITPTGKLVASIVMAIGPSLSSWLIEGRLVARQPVQAAVAPPTPSLSDVVARLDAILEKLTEKTCGPQAEDGPSNQSSAQP